jgi:hypothetical protein
MIRVAGYRLQVAGEDVLGSWFLVSAGGGSAFGGQVAG